MTPTNLLERVADAALRERQAVRALRRETDRLLDDGDGWLTPAYLFALSPYYEEQHAAQADLLAALDALERAGYDAAL